jgi:hypothetical protein
MTLPALQQISPKPGIVRVNSAMLVMGPTGSGKSSLLGTAMEYVWETFGFLTHFVTVDGGGFPTKIQGLIEKGICVPWRARTRDLADGSLSFETCLRAAQGWWPKRLNHRTGECPPGVQLVPPITERYEMSCPNGHLIKVVPFQSLLTPAMCPSCKIHTTKENMRVVKSAGQTKGFEQVGAVMFEGLTSMLSWMLSDMGQRSGRLELKGEEGAIGGKVISGDLKLGGNTRSHVGFAQSRAEELVLNTLSIPNLVIPPIFSALTMEATDEGGLSIRGPKLAGRARTDEGPSWFGNCVETEVRKTDKDERQYRLNLSEYTDESGVRHLCKHRGAPGTMPAFLEDPPITDREKDTAFTQFNLGVFIQLLEKALEQTLVDMSEKYPNAPGVADGWVEVGEGTSAAPSTAPATAEEGQAPVKPAAPAAAQPKVSQPPAQKKPGSAPAAPMAPRAPQAKGKPVVAPVAAPVAPVVTEEAQEAAEAVAEEAETPAAATPATPPVAAKPAPPAPKGWAPPSAPRPPAVAPRLRPQQK